MRPLVSSIYAAAVLGLSIAGVQAAFAQDAGKPLPIAAQMYTLRDAGSVDQQFAILDRAGISNVETVDMQNLSSDELKALLEKHKIKVISSHVPIARMRTELDKVIAEQKAVGNTVITMPYLMPDQRPTDAKGWEALGKELGGYADKLKAEGFSMAYHNHDFELAEFDGKTALEIILAAAGPNLKSELDVAWVARSGHDPAQFLPRLEGRLFAIHAKDNAPAGTAEKEKGFATIGTGILDWAAILPSAKSAGAQWYILEHDMPINAEDVLTKGNAYLKDKLPAVLAAGN
jgi:sugar phosphate isomerase/epimerase